MSAREISVKDAGTNDPEDRSCTRLYGKKTGPYRPGREKPPAPVIRTPSHNKE
jgi:hypothetical protein